MAARVALPIADGVPDWIMWMPAGTHRITGTKRGKPVTVTMRVDQRGAEAVQAALADHLESGKQRPFFDFDHRGEAASAWPLEFAYRDGQEPGIYARVEWSDAGRAAVSGRVYRAFSPMYYESSGDPAEVEWAPLNMGGLTNTPAFRQIAPMWASSNQSEPTNDANDDMKDANQTELAALQARVAELEGQNAELKAKADSSELEAAIQAKDAEIAEAKRQVDSLKGEAASRQRRDAEACVASAVARGAIAAKDETAQKRWADLIIADPKNAELLSRQPGQAALAAARVHRPDVTVLKADTNDILRGYLAAATPKDKGMIYAREISPLISKGENVMARFPVQATNTLGTLVNALVSQRVLELVVSRRPMLRGSVMDFSDEVKSKGDTVTTRTIGIPTVQNFGGTVSAAADADVTTTLSEFKEVRYTFTAAEIVGTSRNLVAERSEAMALSLGNSMVDALAALVTESNFPPGSPVTKQTVCASASVDYSTITAINKLMNTVGVPDTYRFGWVNCAVAEAMANDELIMANFDKSPIASAYGHWTNLKGFADIWEYPALPAGSDNVTGFFASRSALVIAARVPRDPSSLVGTNYPGTLVTVTDPVTGLSVLRNEWVEGASWEVNTRLVTLYGVHLGQAAAGHTLVSS